MIAKAILLFAGIVSAAALIGRTQSAGARGQLVCHGKPEAGVLIKMYDDDRGIDLDDFMGETHSDANGNFQVSGYVDEITTIDPKINIYHDCDDGWMGAIYSKTSLVKLRSFSAGSLRIDTDEPIVKTKSSHVLFCMTKTHFLPTTYILSFGETRYAVFTVRTGFDHFRSSMCSQTSEDSKSGILSVDLDETVEHLEVANKTIIVIG